MFLSELKKSDRATVVSIDGSEELINRLGSFGVLEDSELRVVQFSLAKNTMEINSDGTAIALRISEAKQIKVEKID